MNTQPIVWTIAGSDSGGGAGIQADCAVLRAFGAHPCTVITALTAQNSVTVSAIEATSDAMLKAQLDTLHADLPARAIKIGMLATDRQVSIVADFIKAHGEGIPVVLDPVAISSSGAQLADNSVLQAIVAQLVPLVTVLTPNVPELSLLTRLPVDDPCSLQQAAQSLLARGAGAVLVKGGHAGWQGECAVDTLLSKELSFTIEQTRRTTIHTHGTGCSLASALAAALGHGALLQDAVLEANAYVAQGLQQCESTDAWGPEAMKLGRGPGPLVQTCTPVDVRHFGSLDILYQQQQAAMQPRPSAPFASLREPHIGLYPVVDNCSHLEQVLACGVKLAQLRIKTEQNVSAEALELAVKEAVRLGDEYQAQVFINDHWQLALKHNAYGVHLGQEDLLTADLARIQHHNLALGISTHGYFELLRAVALQPSYIALGHVFPTPTKQMKSAPQGLQKLRHYVEFTGDIPTVAIGGINQANARAVYQCGVDGIAAVRAVAAKGGPKNQTNARIKAQIEAFNDAVRY